MESVFVALKHPPKQFSYFIGAETLFQKTLRRFLKAYPPEDFVIVTGAPFLHLAQAQAKEVHESLENRIIAENEARNTAPAILYALEWLQQRGELTETFLVTPSDHLVAPESEFLNKLPLGESAGSHVLFGIFPTHPHTGYGYIVAKPKIYHLFTVLSKNLLSSSLKPYWRMEIVFGIWAFSSSKPNHFWSKYRPQNRCRSTTLS